MLPASTPWHAAILALAVFSSSTQPAQSTTFLAYPQDTTTGAWRNARPLGQAAGGLGEEARAQMLIPRAFLPQVQGSLVALEVVAGINAAITYEALLVTAEHFASANAFPVLQTTFAANRTAPVTVLALQNRTIQYPGLQWHRLTFTQPFAYNGRDHLLLEFVKSVPPQGNNGLGMVTPRDERTDLPMIVSVHGVHASGAAASPTGNADTHPLRVRLVFAGDVPTTTASSPLLGGVYFGIGNGVGIATRTVPGAPVWQAIDVSFGGLALRLVPFCLPSLAGCTWLQPGPGLVLLPGSVTGVDGVSASTLAVPAAPSLRGLAVVLQAVALTTVGLTWSSAGDFVIG